MIDDLRQLAVTGPLVEVNEVGGDADGPFLIQRQCDEFGPVLTVRNGNSNGTGPAQARVVIYDQVQATRVAPDLYVMQRRPAGAVEVYWFVQFDAQAL